MANRPTSGLSAVFGGNATRTPAGQSDAQQWPNVIITNVQNETITAGDSLIIQGLYQDRDSEAFASVCLDSDANPYNGNETLLNTQRRLNATGDFVVTEDWTNSTFAASPAIYRLYVRVSDADGNTRYDYWRNPITILGLQDVNDDVVTDLTTLLPGVTDPDAREKLMEAIMFLSGSVDPALWIDETHLNPVSISLVFQGAKNAVTRLRQLMKFSESVIPHEPVQAAIDNILKSYRLLVTIAINEAIEEGIAQFRIDQAHHHLAKGDIAAAKPQYESAMEHYRNAYQHAVLPSIQTVANNQSRSLRFDIFGKRGRKYDVETSSDMTDWMTVISVTAGSDGIAKYQEAGDNASPARFYRVSERQLPKP